LPRDRGGRGAARARGKSSMGMEDSSRAAVPARRGRERRRAVAARRIQGAERHRKQQLGAEERQEIPVEEEERRDYLVEVSVEAQSRRPPAAVEEAERNRLSCACK